MVVHSGPADRADSGRRRRLALPRAAATRQPSATRRRLVERVAAGAGSGCVGVVDREALLLDRVHEVDRRTGQIRDAHPIDDHLDAAKVTDLVAVERALVKEQLVAQAGAAARLYGDAQPKVVATLLLEQRLDLAGGVGGKDDTLLRLRGLRCGHGPNSPTSWMVETVIVPV